MITTRAKLLYAKERPRQNNVALWYIVGRNIVMFSAEKRNYPSFTEVPNSPNLASNKHEYMGD